MRSEDRHRPIEKPREVRSLARYIPVIIASIAALALASCAQAPSVLDPQGPRAASIAQLWWIMFGLGTASYVLVMALLLYGLFRRRRLEDDARPAGKRGEQRWIIAGGIILPAIVLLIVYAFTVRSLSTLAAPKEPATVTIEVTGNQWWWEARYVEQDFVTANEIHIPAGEAVNLQLTSNDVIHSFWLPELMGKLDLIPGQVNNVWFAADRPGDYLGECAEFCGVQHAKMRFLVISDLSDDFDAWVELQQQPAQPPDTPIAQQGQEVFLGSACVGCHAIRGTPAAGQIGPDLTHLASRRTIGAGILPNTRGNLAGWIVDSQGIKPGNLMPPMPLDPDDLQALLDYLGTLE